MARPLLVHVTTVPMSLVFLRGQVAYMRRAGLEIAAISSPGPDLDFFAQTEAVPVHAISMSRRITPVRDVAAVIALFRFMRRSRPSVVHSHTPKGGLLGMLAAVMAGVPVRIYHMRGLPMMTATGARRRLLALTEWIACRAAHRVLCVSHSMREVALAEKLCPPDKITVLLGGSGNGVDATGRFNPERLAVDARLVTRHRLGIPGDALVVGFAGRLVRDKGIAELVEAWRVLRDEWPAAHLLLVGPFEPRDPVPAAIERSIREDPRVHLTGMDWDTPPLYASMDLLVLPTHREGFPNTPLEAAAMGLPVIATRIPGCVDAVVDGETGMLVPVRDAASLADAIRRYLREPALRSHHGAAGRRRVVRDFRQEALWDALYVEYDRLLMMHGVRAARADRRASAAEEGAA